MEPGPHAVGYASLPLRDEARPWPSAADPPGALGRPVQVSLWYPALGGGAPMDVRAYLLADWNGGAAADETEVALDHARRAVDAGLDGALGDPQWRRLLATPGIASAGATPLPGARPLVLFENGLGSRSYWNLPLAEVLASHGYVVAALATAGRNESERLGFDLGGLEAQVADMEQALAALAARPEVDADRVGLVAWSVGGVSQALLRMRHPGRFRAAVSLDSGTSYAYGAELLEDAGGLDAEALATPFLQLDPGRASDVPRDDAFFRAHDRAPARRFVAEGLRHGDFVFPWGAGRAAALGPEAEPALRRGTAAVAEQVRRFLDQHLRGSGP